LPAAAAVTGLAPPDVAVLLAPALFFAPEFPLLPPLLCVFEYVSEFVLAGGLAFPLAPPVAFVD